MTDDEVKAQEQLDNLFGNAVDVTIVAGVGYIANRKVAIGRLVANKEHVTRPWPVQLKVSRASVSGGVDLLVIYPPGQFDLPWLACEWTDSCEEFCETASRTGMFLLEFYSPATLRRAMVVNGEVDVLPDQAMNEQVFKDVVAGLYDSSGAPKINARPVTEAS